MVTTRMSLTHVNTTKKIYPPWYIYIVYCCHTVEIESRKLAHNANSLNNQIKGTCFSVMGSDL